MRGRRVVWVAALGVLAVAVAAGAAAAGRTAGVTTIKAVSLGPPTIEVNRYIQLPLRWDKDVYSVVSGGTLKIVNDAADEGPHTFTVVARKDAPKAGPLTGCKVCDALTKAHGADPNSDAPPKFPFLENGVGQSKPPSIDKPGDSGLTGKGKKGESISLKVTAPAGTKLWFVCLIHPWMEAEVDVT